MLDVKKLKTEVFDKTGIKLSDTDPVFAAVALNNAVLEIYLAAATEEIQVAIKEIELQTGATIAAAKQLNNRTKTIMENAGEYITSRRNAEAEAAAVEIRKSANAVLTDTVRRVANEANTHIGKTIESQLSANIAKLTEAEGKLSKATASFGWKWGFLAWGSTIGIILTLILVSRLTVWWHRAEVEDLQATATTLQTNIAAWEKLGGRTKPTSCGNDHRTCIRIDNSAGSFVGKDDNEKYAVIYGY